MPMTTQTRPGELTVAGTGWRRVAVAALVHALIWSVVPALVIGNMHQDTLEAAFWGSDHALGYAEHPPLLSWVIDLVLRAGCPPIVTLLLITQIGMLVAAAYVWRAARLYASPGASAMAAMLFLISPAATVYGVQVNHNSFLAPFWAAALFYALAYLESGKWRDALLFAVATGLGLLVKYEMAFLVVCLLALALAVPRFRAAFRRPATYVAILLVAAIIAPHVVWLVQNNAPSVSYALGARKMSEAGRFALSAGNALVGLFVLFALPAAILVVASARLGGAERPAWSRERGTIGAILAFGPYLVLLIGVVATFQIAKPLWATPMTPSSAVGLTLLFAPGGGREFDEGAIAKAVVSLSAVAMAGFLAYLFVADAIGQPVANYEADSRKLGVAVENFWRAHSSEPLACIVIAEHSIAASAALWTHSRPHYVDFTQAYWSTPGRIERCKRTGGVAVLTHIPGEQAIFDAFPTARGAPHLALDLPATYGFTGAIWPVELVLLAPSAN